MKSEKFFSAVVEDCQRRVDHLSDSQSESTPQAPAVSSFHDFIGEPTAEKACLLAMDDHRSFAGRLADDQFLMMLSIAAEHSKDHAANLARIAALENGLRACQALLNDGDAEPEDADKVSAVIAALLGE